MEFNAWLAARGIDPEALTEEGKKSVQAAWRAEQRPPDPAPNSGAGGGNGGPSGAGLDAGMEAILAAQRAENERVGAITGLVAKYLGENPGQLAEIEQVGKLAVSGKWDLQKTELNLLRVSRGAGPMHYSPGAPDVTAEVVEAAVCRAGGLKDMESQYGDRTLSAVDRRFRRGIGLLELVGIGARQNGWRGDSVKRDLRGALRAAFHGRADYGGPVAVGPSTLSVSGILSNTANKFIREAWMFVEQAWRKVTAIRPVSDFKQITSYSLTGDNQYERVAPGGEIKHGTLGNETYTNQADTYAKILGIDRRDFINDDLGAFTQVNRRLGRGGALKLNDVFWTEWMADAGTFYTAARGNYDDGTDTAFGNDGLTAADVIWQAKTDPDGKPLGALAKILLVPPGHRIAALRLMASQFFGTTGEEGEQNPWAGMFEVVCSTYLANSAYTGYSALAWYMLADPNDLPVIETCFLDGQEMPTVETVEMDSDRLGVAVRAYHDFGTNKQEYRAALKLKGEA